MVHENIVNRLQLLWQKAKQSQAADNVSSDSIDRKIAVELGNIRSEIAPDETIGIDVSAYRTPLNTSSDMELEAIIPPEVMSVASGQIDSSSTNDVVLLTGLTNKVLQVLSILMFKAAGTTQIWRIEMDTGTNFGTTRRISETDANDKETQGQKYYLTANERIVSNVTTAVGASTIDWMIFFRDIGMGTVWQV